MCSKIVQSAGTTTVTTAALYFTETKILRTATAVMMEIQNGSPRFVLIHIIRYAYCAYTQCSKSSKTSPRSLRCFQENNTYIVV